MTEMYVRIQGPKGTWSSKEIEKLTNQELANWALGLDKEQATQWALSLVRWIRENVKEKSGEMEL